MLCFFKKCDTIFYCETAICLSYKRVFSQLRYKFVVIYGGYDMDDQEINEISNAILEKLTPFINEKFGSIEERLDQVEKRLDQISDDIESVSADIESIREYLHLERSKNTGRVMPYKEHYIDYGVLYPPSP